MENNEYRVTIIQPVAATKDQRDGFGDYVNYRERSIGIVGASSALQAIQLTSHLCPQEFKTSMKAVLIA